MTTQPNDAAASVLQSWFLQKPVMALMGEYSAGKSTLLNLLLDGDVLPTKVTATNLPPVWVTYSDTLTTEGLRHDGSIAPVDMSSLGETVREDYLLLRMGVNADLLRDIDVIDTPGISDPKLAKGATAYLGDYLDFVLWCSPCNQAWRQTEKVVWTAFPEALRETSIIVLTRADKMRHASDLAKVRRRIMRETSGLFGAITALNTPLAAELRAQSEGKPTGEHWENSGAAEFYSQFETAISNSKVAQLARSPEEERVTDPEPAKAPEIEATQPKSSLFRALEVAVQSARPVDPEDVQNPFQAKPVSKEPRPESANIPKVSPPVTATVATQEATGMTESASPLSIFRDAYKAYGKPQNFDQIVSLFEHLKDRFDKDTRFNPMQRFVVKQCLSVGETSNVDAKRLIKQAELEIADFDKDSWCIIPTRA